MSTTAATILLVDDEESIQKLLTYPLERDGYRVVQARDGDEAIRRFNEEPIDLVVLDVMLPKLDGLEVCKQLRATSFVPIIMLTARDDEVDKVLGLELGADDYITKPFSPRELVARIGSVLRRTEGTATHESGALQVGGVRLDPGTRRVFAADEEVLLTATEFSLLAQLMRRPGWVFSREQLLSDVWGHSSIAGTRTVDVHVAQLRAKLGDESPIRTVRGVGYSADPKASASGTPPP